MITLHHHERDYRNILRGMKRLPIALTVFLLDKTIVNRSVSEEERWGHEGMWTWLTLLSRVLRQTISFWRSPVWVTSSVQRACASFLGSHVRTTCQTKASQTSRYETWDTIALSAYCHFSWKHLKWCEGLKYNWTHLFPFIQDCSHRSFQALGSYSQKPCTLKLMESYGPDEVLEPWNTHTQKTLFLWILTMSINFPPISKVLCVQPFG